MARHAFYVRHGTWHVVHYMFYLVYILGGSMVYAFDTSQDDKSCSSHVSMPRSGSLNLELNFDKEPSSPLKIFIYSEFNAMITIE